jgi:hypothetical protein
MVAKFDTPRLRQAPFMKGGGRRSLTGVCVSGIRSQESGFRQKVKTYFLPVMISKKSQGNPDDFL